MCGLLSLVAKTLKEWYIHWIPFWKLEIVSQIIKTVHATLHGLSNVFVELKSYFCCNTKNVKSRDIKPNGLWGWIVHGFKVAWSNGIILLRPIRERKTFFSFKNLKGFNIVVEVFRRKEVPYSLLRKNLRKLVVDGTCWE